MYNRLAKKLFNKKILDRSRSFVHRNLLQQFVNDVLEILYPHFSQNYIENPNDLSLAIKRMELKLYQILKTITPHKRSIDVARNFIDELNQISDSLDLDAKAIFAGDPAAKNVDEVIFSYPGFFSIATHRMAHFFYQQKITIIPRMISEYAHRMTGIDIHPGASIGKNFCIDHGTGIVIGETTQIGNNVKIYQGVTLGALSIKGKGTKSKRHPTIEDNCVIYSNATILGGDTIIGKNSVIGGNVWITESVPKNSVTCNEHQQDKLVSNLPKK